MLKLLRKLNKKEIIFILISIIFIVMQVWLDLKLPDYMAKITSLVQTEGSNMKDILQEGFMMLLCALGSLVSAVIVGYFSAYIGSNFAKSIRAHIFTKVNSFSKEEIKTFSTSSLITRATNDVTQVQMLIVIGIQMLIKAPIMAVWAILKIAGKGMEFSIITASGVGIITLLVITLIILVLPKFKIIQSLTDNLNRITRENLTGIRVVRAYNAEDFQQERFDKANHKLTKTNLFTGRLMALISPVMTLVMSGISLSIYFVGAYLINEANMLDKINIFSNMVVFTSYAVQVIMSFMMLVMFFIMYPRASISAKRINEVLSKETSIKEGNLTNNGAEKGLVEFKNVSFKYPDAEEYILKDITFTANKGETVAIIGSTGSGKSTVVNLIPRFYDVTDGEILIDHINIKDYKLENLYDKIGYISQSPILFKGTIKDNITFGKIKNKKPNIKNIESAIKVSQAEEFVNNKDKKLEHEVSQSGTNLSGGQKQRLSIARAIARTPEVYIFDDSFSALDYKTDFILRKELKKYTKEATIIIVAQRIGTIKDAEKIIVLDKGNCVGMGTHKELLKQCKVYKEIAKSQLSKEELAYE